MDQFSRRKVSARHHGNIRNLCQAQAKKNGVTAITVQELTDAKCIEVPEDGIEILAENATRFYPEVSDTKANVRFVGHFNVRGQYTIFVNVDGRSYLTKNWIEIHAPLKRANFQLDADLPHPFEHVVMDKRFI